MALILADGFDHYASTQAAEKFWTGSPFGMVPGRGFGGQAMVVIINNEVRKVFPSSYSTVIAGAALNVDDNSAGVIMSLRGGGVIAASIFFNGGQKLELHDSTGSVIATGTTTLPINSYFYVELKLVKGSSGTATVHLNGAAEIAASTGNYGTANIDTIEFSNHSLSGHTLVDDVYVFDTSGSPPQNDFIGNVRIETLYPVADGSYTAWTPKFGTDHYQMVNEHLIDGDGSFVYDANPGDKDSYILETFIGTIYGAQLNIGARKGDAPLRQIKPLIKQSGTDYLGALATLSSDYVFYSWQLDKDPSGADWLAATINADEFGQELIT